jgi:hypothetical protein
MQPKRSNHPIQPSIGVCFEESNDGYIIFKKGHGTEERRDGREEGL